MYFKYLFFINYNCIHQGKLFTPTMTCIKLLTASVWLTLGHDSSWANICWETLIKSLNNMRVRLVIICMGIKPANPGGAGAMLSTHRVRLPLTGGPRVWVNTTAVCKCE